MNILSINNLINRYDKNAAMTCYTPHFGNNIENDIFVSSSKNSFPDKKILKKAISKKNIIGSGANSIVYNIPEYPDYVLKILNKDDPNKINLSEFPKDINLGQPVWQSAENPRMLLLKKITGEPHSIENWSTLIGNVEPVSKEQAKCFAEKVHAIAKMPQESFDDFTYKVKFLSDKQYKLDSINPNNLIVDNKNKTLNIIDYFKVKDNEKFLYQNSYMDLTAVILDFTLFPEYYDKLDNNLKDQLLKDAIIINDKIKNASENTGLSTNIQKYRTYIEETSKYFKIDGVQRENREGFYERAYEKRMLDFISMIEDPESWAQLR